MRQLHSRRRVSALGGECPDVEFVNDGLIRAAWRESRCAARAWIRLDALWQLAKRRALPRAASASADRAAGARPVHRISIAWSMSASAIIGLPIPVRVAPKRDSARSSTIRSTDFALRRPHRKSHADLRNNKATGNDREQFRRRNFLLHEFIREAISPSPARQRQARVAPLARQRLREARNHRDEILAAAKREQPSQDDFLAPPAADIAALCRKVARARSRRIAQHAGGHPQLRQPGFPFGQHLGGVSRRARFISSRTQPKSTGRDCPDPPGSSPTIRFPDKNPARPAQPS